MLLIVLVTIIVTGCIAGLSWRNAGTKSPSGRPVAAADYPSPLVVDDRSLNFGTVWETDSFKWKLPIRNRGDRDLEIARFATSCSCSSVQPATVKIAPGQSVDIQLTLDLTKPLPQKGPLRDFALTLSPQVVGMDNPPGWTLRGAIRKILTLDPLQINMAGCWNEDEPFPPQVINAIAEVPLSSLSVRSTSERAAVTVEHNNTMADRYRFVITPAGNYSNEPLSFDVVLQPTTSEGPLAARKVHVEGRPNRDLIAMPGSMLIGTASLGAVVRRTVSLQSRGHQSFVVARYTTSTADTSVRLVSGPKADPMVYEITQRITGPKANRSAVKFLVRRNRHKPESLDVPIFYYGNNETTPH